MSTTLQSAMDDHFGLLAANYGFVAIILFVVVISALSDWLKKKSQKGATDTFDPDLFRPKRTPTPAPQSRPMSAWEEEIRKMLQAESSPPPPPIPQPPVRRSPPPVPVYGCDPLINETEGRADRPVPTYLSSMERPDEAFDRGSHLEDRVRARLADVSDHSDSDAAFARATRIDDMVAARMTAAGDLNRTRPTGAAADTGSRSRAEMKALVEALQSPSHAKGAIVASVILGPPKAFER